MTTRNVPYTLVDCGCEATVYDDGSGVEIHYCKLHQNAQKMFDALKNILNKVHTMSSVMDVCREALDE